MSDQLKGKKIAILVANEGVEQVELTSPLAELREAGAEVDLLAPEDDEIQAFNHLDKGDTFAPQARRPRDLQREDHRGVRRGCQGLCSSSLGVGAYSPFRNRLTPPSAS